MPNANDCNDLYFFGDGREQNNPRQVSIMGYEGDRPIFIQFSTVATQTSTQSRVRFSVPDMGDIYISERAPNHLLRDQVYRDQSEAAIFDWTAGAR